MKLFSYDDRARLEYGRMLWKNPAMRARLLTHWTDARHPYHERFQSQRKEVEALLESPAARDEQIDQELQQRGLSLRAIAREIPPVFGSFF